MSSVVVRIGVDAGPSDADLFTEDVVDCEDSERCLFRLLDPGSKSLVFDEGDGAGDGRFMTFGWIEKNGRQGKSDLQELF